MAVNIPESNKPRLVILGAGFAGLTLARKMQSESYQVVLIDKNNYHQFQPLFYQIAMSGLEPSSISFPLRKLFQGEKDVHIRIAEVGSIDAEHKQVFTNLGSVNYDFLVLALGASTNFYGNKEIEEKAYSLKSTGESLYLRNAILEDFEKALVETNYDKRQKYLDIVIVGGGPTGVELAGALAEQKSFIMPKDYPELDHNEIDIYLVQMDGALLKGMSKKSQDDSYKFLEELGVNVKLNTSVESYDGEKAILSNGEEIVTEKLIWAAGIKPNVPKGLHNLNIERGRIKVNEYLEAENYKDIYVLGDLSYLETEEFPNGHPQVAQVAIQQGRQLSKNLRALSRNKEPEQWKYNDKGSMATVGRNKAVVDLPNFSFSGFFAWVVWLGVHLFSLIGTKNKVFVFFNWMWNYLTYDQSLRLILKPVKRITKKEPETDPKED